MSPRIVAELASALKEPALAAETAVVRLLPGLSHPPPLGVLLELGARARRLAATEEELRLAVATLLALHAPPAGRADHGA